MNVTQGILAMYVGLLCQLMNVNIDPSGTSEPAWKLTLQVIPLLPLSSPRAQTGTQTFMWLLPRLKTWKLCLNLFLKALMHWNTRCVLVWCMVFRLCFTPGFEMVTFQISQSSLVYVCMRYIHNYMVCNKIFHHGNVSKRGNVRTCFCQSIAFISGFTTRKWWLGRRCLP